MKKPVRRKRRSLLSTLVKVSVLAVAVYAVYSAVSIQNQVRVKRIEVEALREERDLRTQRVARLNDELDAPFDQENAVRLAREKLGYVMSRERIVIDISR